MKGISKLNYYYALLPNRVGVGAKVMAAFAQRGVDFSAISGFPNGRRVQLDFFPKNEKKFKTAAKELKIRLVGPRAGFLVQGNDHKGAVAEILAKLAHAGVNVIAADAVTAGKNRFGMIFWVSPDTVAKAAKELRAK